MKLASALLLILAVAAPAHAEVPTRNLGDYGLSASAELGFLGVAAHKVQFGGDGTPINYVDDAGQDVLFPFGRMSVDVRLAQRHHLVLLYQPLSLVTDVVLRKDTVIDGLTFPAGTPTRFSYGFPFWRLSYFYEFYEDSPRHSLALGAGMQIRNATINFESLDGKLLRSQRDIGPVPLLSMRGHYGFENGAFIGGEVEGFYAPISYINGSDSEVVGAIVDASMRVGWKLPYNLDVFLNVRYLGGGATGTSEDGNDFSDGYTENWLHFLTTSVGLTVHIL